MQRKRHHKSVILVEPVPAKEMPSTKTPVTLAAPSPDGQVSDADIRVRAYQKWEAAGKPAGDGIQFWLQAEQELRAGK
jgi:hypothetical protein